MTHDDKSNGVEIQDEDDFPETLGTSASEATTTTTTALPSRPEGIRVVKGSDEAVFGDSELSELMGLYHEARRRTMTRGYSENVIPPGELYTFSDGVTAIGIPENWFTDPNAKTLLGGIAKIMKDVDVKLAKSHKRIPINESPTTEITAFGLLDGIVWQPSPSEKMPSRIQKFDDTKLYGMAKTAMIYRRACSEIARNELYDLNCLERHQFMFGNDPAAKDKVTLLRILISTFVDVKYAKDFLNILTKMCLFYPLKVDYPDFVSKCCRSWESWQAPFRRPTLKKVIVTVKGMKKIEKRTELKLPERPSKAILLLDPELSLWQMVANQNWERYGLSQLSYVSDIVRLGSKAFELRLHMQTNEQWEIISLFKQFVGSRTTWYNVTAGANKVAKAEISPEIRAKLFLEHAESVSDQLRMFILKHGRMDLFGPAGEELFGPDWQKPDGLLTKWNRIVIGEAAAKTATSFAKKQIGSALLKWKNLAAETRPHIAKLQDAVIVVHSMNWGKIVSSTSKRSKALIHNSFYDEQMQKFVSAIRWLTGWLQRNSDERDTLDRMCFPSPIRALTSRLYSGIREIITTRDGETLAGHLMIGTTRASQRVITFVGRALKQVHEGEDLAPVDKKRSLPPPPPQTGRGEGNVDPIPEIPWTGTRGSKSMAKKE